MPFANMCLNEHDGDFRCSAMLCGVLLCTAVLCGAPRCSVVLQKHMRPATWKPAIDFFVEIINIKNRVWDCFECEMGDVPVEAFRSGFSLGNLVDVTANLLSGEQC